MRETLFIKKNKAKWEALDVQNTTDPDELSNSYMQVVDDLAYAQTFYPRSHTSKFLNERSVNFYNKIYSKRKEKISTFFKFFTTDLPLAIQFNHRQLLFGFLFFMIFVLIGVLSAMYENDFLGVVVGKGYVEMTKENIQKGDPFGVYKDSNYFLMFVRIALNNILITIIMVYATGLLFGIGTLVSFYINGIMLGSFQYFFFSYGLGWESVLVIWIHGTLEISAIVIAGGAGLSLGNSLLFPRTYTRLESLKRVAGKSSSILVLTFLMLVVAAWLEAYVTHLSSNNFATNNKDVFLPTWASIAILAACFSFLVWYIIIYPLQVKKRVDAAAVQQSTYNA